MDAFEKAVDQAVTQAVAEMKAKDGGVELTASLAAARGAAVGDRATICEIWPVVKDGLELLKAICPAWVRFVIDLLIKIGDRYCKE